MKRTIDRSGSSRRGVPPHALLLSLAALIVPVAATYLRPDWMESQGGLVVWVPAVLPAFLLAYYRGWHGASLGLAATMATLALTQVEILLLDIEAPDWGLMLALVGALVTIALGAGAMAELLHREREHAESRAFTDPLTGIPNRRHAGVFLDAGFGAAQRGAGLAVVLFDMDRFKQINDRQGHAQGDRVLKAFGNILADRTRRMDLSARFGGEEFISVLLDCPIDQAVAFAEEVRAELFAIDFGWGRVTTSAGVAVVEDGMGSPDVLIAAADRALYVAKDHGRDRVWRADQGAPMAPAPFNEPEAPTPIDEARLLVVDDDTVAARTISKLFARLGAEVETAVSAREALGRITAGEDFDVIVTDIVMPEMSGFTLVDLASRIKPGLSVLYMSGYPQEEVYWGGTPGARSAFIGKPLEFDALQPALRRVLGWPDVAHPQGGDLATRRTVGVTGDPDRAEPIRVEGQILVVDDEPAIVSLVVKSFQRAGYTTPLGITDPREAPKIIAKGGIDLLITDMHMPGMTGLELLAALAAVVPADEYFPVLMLTGDTDPHLRRHALAAGVMDFLSKPFDDAEAQARVRNLLSTRALHQDVSGQRDLLEVLVRERTSELADTRTEILHRLARAAEYRDDITGRHAERVGLLASLIAAELGMKAREVDLIRRTGPLHDVGKIGVPDAILRKPGRLSQSEFEIMRTHTTIGRQILGGSRTEILEYASRIAYSHHERYDGRGYPDGAGADDIPIEARIVAVADVFDVLSHTRPYKTALPLTDAVQEIVDSAGGHFDPMVVDAFMSIYERVGPSEFLSLGDPIDPSSDLTEVGDVALAHSPVPGAERRVS